MSYRTNDEWLDSVLPRHHRLTQAVVTILENLLKARSIEYLAVTGRTKDKASAIEKIKRKGYSDPKKQLTDLSGIRVVVFFESDVRRVSNIIAESFCVDLNNSLNKDELLSANEIGYRSVHFVCDLGSDRASLPEFFGLSGLTFEFQVRTLLQHAWAELAHDRNYKFSGKLPREVERKMYLYAGMLEIADKGFDELSSEIDKYVASLEAKSELGNLDTEINSLSLKTFVSSWAKKNNCDLNKKFDKDDLSILVAELNSFGILTLADLNDIIPETYADNLKRFGPGTTIYGVVRDWMLLKDWRRYREDVSFDWSIGGEDPVLEAMLSKEDYSDLIAAFWHPNDASDET